ncbi:MAG: Rpn family recombination-promoting nuclease/putative transposase [Bacteroidales bacterium]|jgi:predicted transposase/invertase (TIGR01784 family)|nr:Rpn family recombination-promoting nuclease/putative transposase [Bacteroidales bacterium]
MARYLDPKNDLVFKRLFGEHPHLLMSFLNAMLQFEDGSEITAIQYIPAELVPETPLKKLSIVDVRCTDSNGRQFIVEMQMEWTSAFMSRMLFNVSKTYVRQLQKSKHYVTLQPVYGLGILNQNFDDKTSQFYHHFEMSNRKNTEETIKGISIVLIELQKFVPEKWKDKKITALWLRFLKEMGDMDTEIPEDLKEDAIIREAVEICEEGGFTEEERAAYEAYWDAIRTEKSVIHSSYEEGREEERRRTVLNAYHEGITEEMMSKITGLSVADIKKIIKD